MARERSITLNDLDGKPAYEVKLTETNHVQIAQRGLHLTPPYVQRDELVDALTWLTANG